jgi:hypothetical protein
MAVTINASTSAGLVQTADTSGVLQLQTNSGTTALTIDTSQNVGVGTTSPTNFGSNFKMLAVQGSDFGVMQAISSSGSTTLEMMGASGVGYVGTRTNHPLVLRTNDTERMRIDSSGNVLVGFNAVVNSSKVLSTFNGSSQKGFVSNETSGASGSTFLSCDINGTAIGSITRNASTNAVLYNTTSDYRLKENIQPITKALDKVSLLKPCKWVWKDCDGAKGEGFIAHEVQEVIPSAVSGEKDAVDENGNIKAQGMDASFLVATLTAAIQELAKASSEQQTLIVSQSELITNLTARITALEAK